MVDGEILERLPDEGAVLISGPPMTGKYDLLLELISETADYSVVISTKYRGSQVIDDLAGATKDRAMPVGIVDCVPSELSIDAQTTAVASTRLRQVEGPSNLTSIGVEFTELSTLMADEFREQDGTVGLHSLAQLVMHSDIQSVYKFLQVIVGDIRSKGWLGLAVMDELPGEERDPSALKHHFDAVLETALAENERKYRLRGQPGASTWRSF